MSDFAKDLYSIADRWWMNILPVLAAGERRLVRIVSLLRFSLFD
jgi:hypothetical protein